MMAVVLALMAVVLALGCADDAPRECAALGWTCGLDDTGRACGTCGGGMTCAAGACEVPPFGACEVGGPACGTMPDGARALCTALPSGRAYCEPVCVADADCDKWSGASGRYECRARYDGAQVCLPR